MAPSDYIQSRELASQTNNGGSTSSSSNQFFTTLVDGRPYLPNLAVTLEDSRSIQHASLVTVILSIYIAISSNGSTNIDDGAAIASSANTDDSSVKIKVIMDDALPLPAAGWDWNQILGELVDLEELSITRVTGGITNALLRVSGFQKLKGHITQLVKKLLQANNDSSYSTTDSIDNPSTYLDFDSILIRIFGAEGMINRDIETSTYSALCNADIAYRYLSRFQNGRIEGWLDGYVPLTCTDLVHEDTSLEIAKEMARLHCLFEVPEGELRDHHFGSGGGDTNANAELNVITVGLWDQLSSWMEQANGYSEFKTAHDTERVTKLELDKIEMEVQNFISLFNSTDEDDGTSGDSTASICGSSAKVVCFCHNDLLAANIMRHPTTSKIQLIDFEYGGTNYAAFDIANHFNEHAGGTSVEENGATDYSRFPNAERQQSFCVEYVKTTKRLAGKMESDLTEPNNDDNNIMEGEEEEEDVLHVEEATELLNQVKKFLMINDLYWGLWAINQAAEEGCGEFDYINYATNRFNHFRAQKAEFESK